MSHPWQDLFTKPSLTDAERVAIAAVIELFSVGPMADSTMERIYDHLLANYILVIDPRAGESQERPR